MKDGLIAALAQRIANAPALQRAMVEVADMAGMARLLADIAEDATDKSSTADCAADWEAWLREAQSRRDDPAIWQPATAPPADWLPVRLFEAPSGWWVE